MPEVRKITSPMKFTNLRSPDYIFAPPPVEECIQHVLTPDSCSMMTLEVTYADI